MANEYLKRTPTSSGNQKVWTWAGWVKRNEISNDSFLFSAGSTSGNWGGIHLNGTRGVGLIEVVSNSVPLQVQTIEARRDASSWLNIVVSVDTTKENSQDRLKIYVDGVNLTNFQSHTVIQNYDTWINSLTQHGVGRLYDGASTFVTESQMFDVFLVDGQALTPDVFGFYKDGDGYVSAGSTQATDFRPGQWMPHAPRVIKKSIERSGGFGVNGFYLPMNDSSNPGADFHCDPNSIIKLKGEDLPQPQNGAPTTTDAYVSQLRQETGTLGFDGVVKFDGVGDYLTFNGSSIDFGTGDFTVEAFVYHTGGIDDTIISDQTGFTFTYGASGNLRFYHANGSNIVDATTNYISNRWVHVAVVRSSNTLTFYQDGNAVGSHAYSNDIGTNSTTTYVGRYFGGTVQDFKGFVSNLRVIQGTALYTANFTAPTEPLTNVTNTKLLCCNSTKAPESATVAPTIGTYVQNWTENTSSDLDGYNGIGAIYDSQLGTSNRGGNSSSHDGSYETLFDGQSVAVSSTIDIYWNGVAAGQRVIRVNGTTEINGGSGALTPGWDSHSFSGTVTKLEVKTANTGSYGIAAVRIDSNILTTPLTSNGGVVSGTNEMSASLVLAVPGISTATGSSLVTNGTFDTNTTGWTSEQSATLSVDNGRLKVLTTNANFGSALQTVTGLTVGQRYTFQADMIHGDGSFITVLSGAVSVNSGWQGADYKWRTSFTAGSDSLLIDFQMASNNNIHGFWDNVVLKQEDAPRDYSADIKGSGTNKTVTPVGNAGVGYELGNYYGSAMTFDGNGDEFTIPANVTDLQLGGGDFTIESWIYPRVYNSGNMDWIGKNGGSAAASEFEYGIFSDGRVAFYHSNGSTYSNTGVYGLILPAGTAPVDQWTHIVGERHGNTFTAYINGVAAGVVQNFLSGGSMPSGTADTCIGSDSATTGTNWHWDGRIQDLRIYKGLAKYKGGFDVPKPYTPVGIEAFRTTDDTCKNNFATWNPLVGAGMASGDNVAALKDGNLYYDNANQSWATSTIGVSSGKYYAEFMVTGGTIGGNLGVCGDNRHGKNNQNYHTARGISYIRLASTSVTKDYNATSITETAGDAPLSFESGAIVGITIDYDNKQIKYYKNGTLIRTDSTPASYTPVDFAFYFLAFRTNDGASGANWSDVIANFGQNPSFSGYTTAGTNADDNGKGLFKYAPPSGFLALCEDNLPTPAIADPGDHFKCVLYGGDSSSGRSITGVGFQPDLVWIKRRNGSAVRHYLFDSIRGPLAALDSAQTIAEVSSSTWLQSFDSNGFSLGTSGGLNGSGNNYVAWCWKAGGAAVSNTDGSITTQVSANPTAGFSIVKGTQTNGTTTFGHGLGKAPKMVITKQTDGTTGWYTYHKNIGSGNTLRLDNNSASTSFPHWVTDPTTSVFSMGSGFGVNEIYVAYCFAEIEGYSKIGSYTGNGSTDGPFVYCGFKPAWVMVKNTSATSDWRIYDSSRISTNPNNLVLYTNLSDIDTTTSHPFDLLSNGFKIRGDFNDVNTSTHNYIFMAFAESPFQTANAK